MAIKIVTFNLKISFGWVLNFVKIINVDLNIALSVL